jgi:hypothetical protein
MFVARAIDGFCDERHRTRHSHISHTDDQEELFKRSNMPSLAIFYGQDLLMHTALETWKNPPAWLQTALRGYAMDAPHRFEGAPRLATRLIAGTGIGLAFAAWRKDAGGSPQAWASSGRRFHPG